MTNSIVRDNTGEGVQASRVFLSGNTITNHTGSGVTLYVPNLTTDTSSITNNTITNNTYDAVCVQYNNAAGLPSLSGNTISGNSRFDGVTLGGTMGISTTWPSFMLFLAMVIPPHSMERAQGGRATQMLAHILVYFWLASLLPSSASLMATSLLMA